MTHFTVHITSKCNQNCIFCSCDKNDFYHLTFEEIKKEVKAARRDASMLVIQGGEPTIHENFIEIISYAKSIGYVDIFAISNGRMFSYPEFTKKAFAAGLTGVNFSIHGYTKDIADSLTRASGSFVQALNGIRNVSQYTRRITVRCILQKENMYSLNEFLKLIADINPLIEVEFTYPIPHGNARFTNDHFPDQKELVKILNSIDYSLLNKIEIRNIPYCISLSDSMRTTELFLEKKFGEIVVSGEKIYEKTDACKDCILNHRCLGIHHDLINTFLTPNPILKK